MDNSNVSENENKEEVLDKDTFLQILQGIRNDIARMDRDQGEDRNKMENLALAVTSNTAQVKSFGERLEILERKIKEKVADAATEATAPALEAAQNLQNTIIQKQVVAVDKEQTKKQVKRPFWKFWGKNK